MKKKIKPHEVPIYFQIGVGEHKGRKCICYLLDKRLTDTQKEEYRNKYDCDFITIQRAYAPEIKYDGFIAYK